MKLTSSVDRDSEDEIWQCIKELKQSRTLIIISHRLSTIQRANNIIVLNKGQLVEQGSHEELLDKQGNIISWLKNKKSWKIRESRG
ncbi:hypothetical protein SD457_16910 [Coprobacillaceae bacterium CR2/5/TPMF4]|nr:hypothetical protein SD457_16910 [Coprobacillaceae bacterium CR2/5/TPMF4]